MSNKHMLRNSLSRAAACSLLLLLGACGQKGAAPAATPPATADQASGDAAEARERALAEQRQAKQDAAVAKRRDTYRAALAPLLAGSYAGTCQVARGSDSEHLAVAGAPVKEKVEVSPAGMISALGVQRDLMHSSDTLVIRRTFDGGKVASATAVAGGTEPLWTFSLQTGREDKVLLTGDTSAIDCGALGSAATLRDKPLWPVVAGFFKDGAATLSCAKGGVTHANLAIKPTLAGIEVDGHMFSFDKGLSTEMAGYEKEKNLTYTADFDNGVKLLATLDRDGKLAQLIAAGAQDAQFDCQREEVK